MNEWTIALMSESHGVIIISCCDPVIDGDRGSIRLETNASEAVVTALHELRSTQIPFRVEAGTNFTTDHAVMTVLRSFGREAGTHRIDLEIRAVKTVPARQVPGCCGEPMRTTGMGGCPQRPAYLCNLCERYCGPLGARTPAEWWRPDAHGTSAWEHAQGATYALPVPRPALQDPSVATGADLDMCGALAGVRRLLGTRDSIRAALLSIVGVRYAEVLDRNTVPQIDPDAIAAIVIYDRDHETDFMVARCLYDNVTAGVATLGTELWFGMRWYTFESAPPQLRQACINIADGSMLDVLSTELHVIQRGRGEPDVEFRVRMQDPLEVVIDSSTLRQCIAFDEMVRREEIVLDQPSGMTPAQLAAVSAHWSAQLSAKVESSDAAQRAAQEARKVTVVIGIDAEDMPW